MKNSIGMEFVTIPEGEFLMGDSANPKCKEVYRVKLAEPFLMGKYPVTQEEWVRVMGTNPSRFKGDRNPVETVSWYDAQEFIKKLNEMEGTDTYRLPYEIEWEYAAKAGGNGEEHLAFLDQVAWHGGNSNLTTHPVGEKMPNAWGLYDIYGNVWEWCQDQYESNLLISIERCTTLEDKIHVFRSSQVTP